MSPSPNQVPTRLVMLGALLFCATPVVAQVPDAVRPSSMVPASAPAPLRTEARMALQMEDLSNGYDDWHDASFEITSDAGLRRRWFATFHDVRRFDLRDDLFGGGYIHPVGKKAAVSFEAHGSLSHHVVPRVAVSGRIDAAVGRGWVLNAGVAERRYDTGDVTLLTTGIEHYAGRFRLAYTSYGAFLHDTGNSWSHSATVDSTYGSREENIIGLTVAAGEELEQDVHLGLRTSDVRAISARGRHWLGTRIGLLYSAGIHEQGTSYTRRNVTAGLAFRF